MINSITVNGQTFAVGRCLPGNCFSPTIATIFDRTKEWEDHIDFIYMCFDEGNRLLASIQNGIVVTYEQKEALECAKL